MSRIAGLSPEDVLARMTLAEKIGQLNMVTADTVVTGPAGPPDGLKDVGAGRVGAVLNLWGPETWALQRRAVEETRLGVPLLFCLDVIHGHRTVFPVPLGEAAAFDEALWRETAAGAAADGVALTFAPMADVARDPRWGRICESAGEDPLVNARMAAARVAGFQGDDLAAPDRIAATVKHFVAYGAGAGGREYDAVDVSAHALETVYFPPFHAAVRAGVAAVMAAFPAVNGAPVHASRALLTGQLRAAWGFGGVIIADYNGVSELIVHGAAENGLEAAALAFSAGVDVDMCSGLYLRHLAEAVEKGLVDAAAVDAAALRVLRLKQRLGLFEDPFRGQDPAGGGASRPAAIRRTARRAAQASFTLLQDPRQLLPLPADLRRIAVIGELATSARDMLGAWAISGDRSGVVTIADGVREAWPQARTAVCGDDVAAAFRLASRADVAILCIGETADMSGEGRSRAAPGLPERHEALLQATLAAGRPVVVLLSSGRPLAAPRLFASDCAVLAIWGPGAEAGRAVADVLCGAVSPGGRTPVTWPRDVGQIPLHYARGTTGRPHRDGQRFTNGYADLPLEPQFCFGHGLSYARFVWSGLRVEGDARAPEAPLAISLAVRHAGPRRSGGGWNGPATETVFLFVRARSPGRARPQLLLRDFARISLEPGQEGRVVFRATLAGLAAEGTAAPEPPSFLEVIVAASADLAASAADGRCLRQVLAGGGG
ncbi:glycoside hydrolase family 3 N-terminal domain-containing protein [Camelimonas abortus]|uniref:beta-glucosidase n=1 Tax=Camelimonas abortus TaxID=1017184 RepID=A0ABV7LCU5_9HYPH